MTLCASRSHPVIGQTPIRIGQTVEGRLDEGHKKLPDGTYYDLFVFKAECGQRIAIDLKSEFDPYLTLMDKDGTEIVSDHNSGGDHDARVALTVSYAGKYFIRVNSLRKGGKGKYLLQLK